MSKVTHILAALQQAVSEGAHLPADERDALFKRSFEQAGEELAKAVAPQLPAPGETDHVTLLGTHLRAAEEAVRAIEAGEALLVGGSGPSGEALTLAKAWLDLGEIALVTMAAEQAAPVGENEQPGEGLQLVKVALGEGDGAGEVLVKTALPEHLHGLIAPPDAIAFEIAALGRSLYDFAGGDALAKGYDEGDEEDEGDEPPMEDGDDMGDEPEGGLADGLQTLAKIGQMAVMQVAAIKDEIGDGEELDGEAGEMSALDAIAAHGTFITQQADMLMRAAAGDIEEEEMAPEDLERGAKAGDLKKGEAGGDTPPAAAEPKPDPRVDALEKALAETREQLAKLQGQPADPKGVLKAAGIAMTKQADNGGGEQPRTVEEMADDLMKMDPKDRANALFKMALAAPVAVLGGTQPQG